MLASFDCAASPTLDADYVWLLRTSWKSGDCSFNRRDNPNYSARRNADGQGTKRDCSTAELRPGMVGATGFEPMTDNPCLRPIKSRADYSGAYANDSGLIPPRRSRI